MSEQIQNISNEILEYKDKVFVKIFSNAHYLNFSI